MRCTLDFLTKCTEVLCNLMNVFARERSNRVDSAQSVPYVGCGDTVYRGCVWAGPDLLASSANKVPSAKVAEDVCNSRFPKRVKTVSLDIILLCSFECVGRSNLQYFSLFRVFLVTPCQVLP